MGWLRGYDDFNTNENKKDEAQKIYRDHLQSLLKKYNITTFTNLTKTDISDDDKRKVLQYLEAERGICTYLDEEQKKKDKDAIEALKKAYPDIKISSAYEKKIVCDEKLSVPHERGMKFQRY